MKFKRKFDNAIHQLQIGLVNLSKRHKFHVEEMKDLRERVKILEKRK